jgi:outer membrane lipopolysaccharide assembly protein LptE/RlpB
MDVSEGKNGVVWISDSPVTHTRDLRFDANAVLGTANEQTQLNADMRRDAVLQILRQLQYAKEPVSNEMKPADQSEVESESAK